MPFAVCVKADGTIRSAARWDRLAFNEATEVLLELPEMPDRTAKRWDGAAGLRDATPQELATTAAAAATAREDREWDSNLLLMALARWTAQKLGVSPATAKSEILAIYRALPR